ncbi:MAG: SprB repeat-containing protein, partial [Flavobacteriales bacterium]
INNGSTFQPSGVFDGLNDGVNYNVVVRDVNGCTTTYSGNPIVLNGPTTPVLSVTTSNVQCNGAEDGEINITVTSGGTPFYAMEAITAIKTYQDTASAVSELVTMNVVAGTYNLTVTDRFGCETTAGPYTISQPSAIDINTTVVNNTNCTGTDGSITVTASGGTPGFQYSLNGGGFSGTNVLSNLGTGSYPIIVRDANGCEIPFEEEIGGPFVVDAGNDRYLCEGSSLTMNAQLDVTAVTVAGGANYSQTSISHNPRTPSSWSSIGLGDDQVSGWINMPFTFNFYGTNFTRFRVSSNGFMTFNDDGSNYCCTGSGIPSTDGAENMIALCWEDLNPNSGGV